jgi:hypothetical protein
MQKGNKKMVQTIDFDAPEILNAAAKTEMPAFNPDALFSAVVCSEPTSNYDFQDFLALGNRETDSLGRE